MPDEKDITPTAEERLAALETEHLDLVRRVLALQNREDRTIAFTLDTLRRWAGQVNAWAAQSRAGGWGTHQVKANLELAAEIHRAADEVAAHREQLFERMRQEQAEREQEGGAHEP